MNGRKRFFVTAAVVLAVAATSAVTLVNAQAATSPRPPVLR